MEEGRQKERAVKSVTSFRIGLYCMAVSLAVYIVNLVTGSFHAYWLYFLMIGVWPIAIYSNKDTKTSPIGEAINRSYTIIGWVLCASAVLLTIMQILNIGNPIVLFPLSLILLSVGNIVCGTLLKANIYIFTGCVVLLFSVWVLNDAMSNLRFPNWFNLGYTASSFLLWVLPYFILDKKEKEA